VAKAEKNGGQKPPTPGASSPSLRRPARAELIWDGKYDAMGLREDFANGVQTIAADTV
jgi:hypothetical protein